MSYSKAYSLTHNTLSNIQICEIFLQKVLTKKYFKYLKLFNKISNKVL